jgi:peroxiredoxin
MLGLGSKMPEFSLTDATSGRIVSSKEFESRRAVLVMFICNHCPFVVHVKDELARLSRDYGTRPDVGLVGICSNDAKTHPDDAPELMKEMAAREGWQFPYLADTSQDVAKAYQAACTPDFFLFGPDGTLAYRGQLDDSRPGGAVPVTGSDLRAALDAVLAGRAVPADQKPSMGCNIKWRAGGEPEWFPPR